MEISSVQPSKENGKYTSPSGFAETAGIAAGISVYDFSKKSLRRLNRIPGNKIRHILSTIDNNEIKSKIPQMMESSGLNDKGVKINDLSGCDFKPQLSELKKRMNDIPNNKEFGIFEKFKQLCVSAIEYAKTKSMQKFAQGKNAAFILDENSIAVNLDKRALSLTHEMGHAQNLHFSKFWGAVQKSRRYVSPLVPLIALIAVIKRKKGEGEETHGVLDKTTTFVKDNAGKLTVLAFVPTVAEEIKASINGNKLAKQFYSPELYQKLLKHTKLCASTYVISGIAATAAVWAAKNVRDLIAPPKETFHG